MGLNPCFSGRWSLTLIKGQVNGSIWSRLNPCFSGRWSLTRCKDERVTPQCAVLILVLVEDGLWQAIEALKNAPAASLNPCFSGRWSLTFVTPWGMKKLYIVLILVLVEDGLWQHPIKIAVRQRLMWKIARFLSKKVYLI